MNVLAKPSHGFTLIELMIVIAIIGILSTMAIPTYHDRIIQAQVKEALAISDIAKQAVANHYRVTQSFPADNQAAELPAPGQLIDVFMVCKYTTHGKDQFWIAGLKIRFMTK